MILNSPLAPLFSEEREDKETLPLFFASAKERGPGGEF